MPSFRLTRKTITKLTAKFNEFQEARRKIHETLALYVNDYKNFPGDSYDRREVLAKNYMPLAPDTSHLIFQDNKIFWQPEDIAIIIGRDSSAVTRVINRMKLKPGWVSRILALEHENKSANNNIIHSYDTEIFDLILDKYEHEYLERFTRPRHGKIIIDSGEVTRLWEYLKAGINHDDEIKSLLLHEESQVLPELPLLSWYDVIMLILRKTYTPKNLTLLTFIFAGCYQVIKFCPVMKYFFAVIFVLTLVICSLLLRLRKFKPGLISDIAALSLMTAALYFFPGSVNNNAEANKITLTPEITRGQKIIFRVNLDSYDKIREIFYSLNDSQFISTGFNDFHYPGLIIEPDNNSGTINLRIKYIDTDNNESNVYAFTFDLDNERTNLAKNFLMSQINSWLYISKIAGTTTIYVNRSIINNTVVSKVFYGINTESPDKIFIPEQNKILSVHDDSIKFVSSYLEFIDGTHSQTRIAKP